MADVIMSIAELLGGEDLLDVAQGFCPNSFMHGEAVPGELAEGLRHPSRETCVNVVSETLWARVREQEAAQGGTLAKHLRIDDGDGNSVVQIDNNMTYETVAYYVYAFSKQMCDDLARTGTSMDHESAVRLHLHNATVVGLRAIFPTKEDIKEDDYYQDIAILCTSEATARAAMCNALDHDEFVDSLIDDDMLAEEATPRFFADVVVKSDSAEACATVDLFSDWYGDAAVGASVTFDLIRNMTGADLGLHADLHKSLVLRIMKESWRQICMTLYPQVASTRSDGELDDTYMLTLDKNVLAVKRKQLKAIFHCERVGTVADEKRLSKRAPVILKELYNAHKERFQREASNLQSRRAFGVLVLFFIIGSYAFAYGAQHFGWFRKQKRDFEMRDVPAWSSDHGGDNEQGNLIE